jgi:Protein of unknown function (DUF2950)
MKQTKLNSTSATSDNEFTNKVLEDGMSRKHHGTALTIRLLLLALIVPLSACKKSDTATNAETPSVTVFATPDDASTALLTAAKAADQNTLLGIFGQDAKGLLHSGDDVQDKNTVEAFVTKFAAMHRWREMPDGSQMLLVGADNFPFAIPLKKNADGKWFFDTAAGRNEVLNRRIGRNELAIIAVCGGIEDAESEYYSQPHQGEKAKQFAAKFISDPGKQNGLYWQVADGQHPSPLGPMAAFATAEGYTAKPEGHTPFHGYYFHMLKGQTDKAPGGAKDYMVDGRMTNGFAFVAYPAEYGNSGIMTFMMNQDGVLLQKDLGKSTTETATAMTTFDPDPAWIIVQP